MQGDNRLFDDLSRVATGAFSALAGVREEVEVRAREQFEKLLGRANLVTREEFDVVQAMAAKARAEQEVLADRLAALEARLAALSAPPESPPSKPVAARKRRAAPLGKDLPA
ncbi:MAG TPA: accessory factor UbiK family protein [Stellaceae bacterium]|nr:accessory factor UbiK family protein [Stellaceae bacterium]